MPKTEILKVKPIVTTAPKGIAPAATQKPSAASPTPDEPDPGHVVEALVALTKRGLLWSFKKRHLKGVVRIAMTLNAPMNDIDKEKTEEFVARVREYNRAWAIWHANSQKGGQ